MPQDTTSEPAIRVLVADNSRMHTQLLADALRRDRRLEVIGSESHTRDLVQVVISHKVDVVVLASHLDEEAGRGLEVLRELRNARPEIRTILLLDSSKREVVVEAFRAGARGLFSRHESLETLSKCVRRVHEGQVWANSQQTLFAVEALASSPALRATAGGGLSLLSKRELDVVHCLAEGLTNREIAVRLGLSQHTIKNYLFRVFDKLGVSSRVELLFLTFSQSSGRSTENGAPSGGGEAELPAANITFAEIKARAEHGSASAQLSLAEFYRQGKEVPKDMVAAYMWYLLAERTAVGMKEEISLAKKALAESLSSDETAEAQRRAFEYLKSIARTTSTAAKAASSAGIGL